MCINLIRIDLLDPLANTESKVIIVLCSLSIILLMVQYLINDLKKIKLIFIFIYSFVLFILVNGTTTSHLS